MGKRSKPQPLVIADAGQATGTMRELADLGRRLDHIRLDLEANIDRLREQALAKAAPLAERKAALEDGLCAFATIARDTLLGKRKSVDTPFGRYGFRQSTKLKPLPKVKMEQVLTRLADLGEDGAIKTTRTVDREAMRPWTDERLKNVGMRRVIKDEFYIEVTQEQETD